MNKCFFLVFLFCALTLGAVAQATRNIEKRLQKGQLTEEEIIKYQMQVQENKLSLDQVESMLSDGGFTQAEIDRVKARIGTSKSGNTVVTGSGPRGMTGSEYKTSLKMSSPGNIYGSSFFTSSSLSFEPNLRIATPASYVLGPDDELLINISGYQEATIKAQVQPEGTITIPQVGVISVSGLTIEDATRAIRGRMIQTAYPNIRNGLTRLNITLGKIRSIHITIIGATKPGNYTVSSLTTLFNSLFICGGPDSINTFREIELIRNNKVAHRIDLYQFLSKGDLSGNVLLSENDVINFPVYKKRVTLSGEVKRKGIFELLEAETMDKLLFYAGGFTNSAFTASIKVKQVTETDRRVRDIPKSEYLSYRPANGDEIIVEQIPERIENAVTISGSVFMPGAFEFSEGLTAGALIKKAGGLREDAFPDRGMITRTRDDKTRENIPFKVSDMVAGKADILLKKQDEIQISSSTAFRSEYTVFIEGEVRKAGYYPYKDNLSVKDILFLAGSFTDAATSYNIAVSRRITTERAGQPADSIARVFFINTGKDLSFTGDAFILQPFDIVTVRRNPGYNEQKRVTINGEIMYPGLYTISTRQERLSDLFKKAGGLTPSAYIQGVSLTRKVKESLKLNDTIRKKNIAMMQSGIKDLNSKVIRDVDATTVKIAVNMDKILAEPGSEDDYILEEGDVINIAKFDPLVKLSGEVLLGTKVNYEAGRSMKYYLNRAGGITDNARLSKIYVVYANGQLDKTDSHLFGLIRSYPKIKAGAEIVVPAKSPRRGLSAAETVGITSAIVSIFAVVVVTLNSISK